MYLQIETSPYGSNIDFCVMTTISNKHWLLCYDNHDADSLTCNSTKFSQEKSAEVHETSSMSFSS